MTKIENLYHEPIVVYLLSYLHGQSTRNRFQKQLLVGECIEVADDSISPELLFMAKKGRVKLTTLLDEPSVEPSEVPVNEATAVKKDSTPQDEGVLIEELEQELLE